MKHLKKVTRNIILDIQEDLSRSGMEPEQIQEFESSISTLQEQLYQQNTVSKIYIKLFL
jgi:hypothetical protein